jgi:hypothetical protein
VIETPSAPQVRHRVALTVKRVWSWLRGFFRWLGEPRLAWLTLLVVVLALEISLQRGATEFQVRASGLGLEWFGLVTVAIGVRETRKLFGRPSLGQLVRGWVSRFPRWRGKVIVMPGTGSLSLGGGSARLSVWSKVDPTAPLQDQMTAIARNVERLNERIDGLHREVDEGLRKHTEALGAEQRSRAQGDQDLNLRLEAAAAGGLHITFMGTMWLFLGALLATLSPEIAAHNW